MALNLVLENILATVVYLMLEQWSIDVFRYKGLGNLLHVDENVPGGCDDVLRCFAKTIEELGYINDLEPVFVGGEHPGVCHVKLH